jgi:aminocyclopropanecarboxylate oxidase
VDGHGVDAALMEEVKRFVYGHYDEQLEDKFYASDLAKDLQAAVHGDSEPVSDQVDWESAYFIRHHPNNNVADFPEIPPPTRSVSPISLISSASISDALTLALLLTLRKVLDTYIGQMVSLAERLAECMSLNLGLDCGRIKDTFAPPFVGTKFAMYPACPRPDLVWGLRAHTDAGGIILLLQDDVVGGLEFFRGDREWVPVGPTKGSRIFVNIGDQVEVMSGGAYRSVLHRVAAGSEGRRLSVATFYNPGTDAVVAAPVTPLQLYPGPYRFGDYLDYYQATKFSDKAARFRAVREMFG